MAIQRVFYGPAQERFAKIVDADKLERFYGAVLIAVMFLIGIFPMVLTNVLTSGIAASPLNSAARKISESDVACPRDFATHHRFCRYPF